MKNSLIAQLPYGKNFLFVDKIVEVSEQKIIGSYYFKDHLFFYDSHFPKYAIIPGVILTECAAQIGLACFGIFLEETKQDYMNHIVVLSESNMHFLHPVYPNQTVLVTANLVYFRFNKLKVNIEIHLPNSTLIAKGSLSGMKTKIQQINA